MIGARSDRRSVGPPCGLVTLTLAFFFILLFRIEQNVAYVLGISSRQLVGLDVFPVGAVVQVFAPALHATPGHLISTLVWFIPFGYFLERRRGWEDYVSFVAVAGVLSTTLGPAVFLVLGVSSGLAIGGSGITYALVGREATARLLWVAERRSLSRGQWAILAIVIVGMLFRLLSFVSESPANTSVSGHATGLLVGILAGVGEQYVSITTET